MLGQLRRNSVFRFEVDGHGAADQVIETITQVTALIGQVDDMASAVARVEEGVNQAKSWRVRPVGAQAA